MKIREVTDEDIFKLETLSALKFELEERERIKKELMKTLEMMDVVNTFEIDSDKMDPKMNID